MEKENLTFSAGVMPSIFSIIKRFAAPGENIVIQSPVYNNFYNCIENSDCNVVENQFLYKDGAYSIDFTDLEQKLSNPQTTVMILCNPHNPIGKIWSAEDLAKIGELAKKYNVTVISDEIHCDITEPGKSYVPFAAASLHPRRLSTWRVSIHRRCMCRILFYDEKYVTHSTPTKSPLPIPLRR